MYIMYREPPLRRGVRELLRGTTGRPVSGPSQSAAARDKPARPPPGKRVMRRGRVVKHGGAAEGRLDVCDQVRCAR